VCFDNFGKIFYFGTKRSSLGTITTRVVVVNSKVIGLAPGLDIWPREDSFPDEASEIFENGQNFGQEKPT
jgi:hypothetical protein